MIQDEVIFMHYRQRIRELREDNDYTQTYIAKLLNIGHRNYPKYELGKYRIPVQLFGLEPKFFEQEGVARKTQQDGGCTDSCRLCNLYVDRDFRFSRQPLTPTAPTAAATPRPLS